MVSLAQLVLKHGNSVGSGDEGLLTIREFYQLTLLVSLIGESYRFRLCPERATLMLFAICRLCVEGRK